jgi:sulfoxide reductase heme-binding subunit YedZ
MNLRREWSVSLAWVAAALAIALLLRGDGDAYSLAVARTRGFGYLAFVALCCALCVTPIARVLGARWPGFARWRRALGLAACAGAAAHALLALSSWPSTLVALWNVASLRAGMTALLILVLLGLTSFPALVKRAGLRAWKELHRLAYVALACAVWHAILQPYAAEAWILGLAAGCVGVGVLRALPKR